MKKVKYFITIAGISLIAGITHADVFPKDALNANLDIIGASSAYLFTPASGSVYTVFFASYNTAYNDNNATLKVNCNGNLAEDIIHANNFSLNSMGTGFRELKCYNSAIATVSGVTGSKLTDVTVVYVPYNTASKSSDMPDRLGLGTASSSFTAYASMTAGDVLIILLLCALVMLQLFNIFRRHA